MDGGQRETPIEEAEERDVNEHGQLSALVVYETIRREGANELERPAVSLWWSGLAAGVGMGFSLVVQGILHAALPDASWRPLIETLGYTVGFVIVILSRHQLFTENTLTAILPLLHAPSGRLAFLVARLWAIVLVANIIGTALFAWALQAPQLIEPSFRSGILEVARQVGDLAPGEVFWRSIPAGWLLATLVWMLPSAETAKVAIIIVVTYIISLAHLTHVVAGSTEVLFLVFSGEMSLSRGIFAFILPMLIGNIIGGSALFALLSFGQVKEELE